MDKRTRFDKAISSGLLSSLSPFFLETLERERNMINNWY